MSNELEIKKAVQDAKKSLEEEKSNHLKEQVKSIVKNLLEAIDSKEKTIKNHQDELSILKKDLKDLEAGRLDLIEERQKNNEVAARISPVRIKRLTFDGTPWHGRYEVVYKNSPWMLINPLFGDTNTWGTTTCAYSDPTVYCGPSFTATGNAISMMAVGTYTLASGKSVDVRPFYN